MTLQEGKWHPKASPSSLPTRSAQGFRLKHPQPGRLRRCQRLIPATQDHPIPMLVTASVPARSSKKLRRHDRSPRASAQKGVRATLAAISTKPPTTGHTPPPPPHHAPPAASTTDPPAARKPPPREERPVLRHPSERRRAVPAAVAAARDFPGNTLRRRREEEEEERGTAAVAARVPPGSPTGATREGSATYLNSFILT